MLRERVITAAVLLVVFALVLFVLPPFFFYAFVMLVAGVGAWEWSRLAGLATMPHQLAYVALVAVTTMVCFLDPDGFLLLRIAALLALGYWAFVIYTLLVDPERESSGSEADLPLLGAGVFVLVSTALALAAARFQLPEHSVWLLLYVMALVWAMDIGAYFTGRRFGRVKLAPLISPGKTREGVYGGVAAALCLMVIALLLHSGFRAHAGLFLLASLAAALVSVAGDLSVSRLKRSRGIKDTSQLLPGHGGVLDRIDGVVAALPVFAGIWTWV